MTQVVAFGLLTVLALIAAITDLRTGQIYNWLTYPAVLVGLAWATVAGGVTGGWSGAGDGLIASVLGMLAGLLPFAVLFLSGIGLGGGDVKLMAAVGAIAADWHVVLGTAWYGLWIAMAMAVVVMIRHGLVRRTLGRLWSAAMTASAGVKPLLPEDSPRIAFGAAAGAGAILAGAEWLLQVPLPWSLI